MQCPHYKTLWLCIGLLGLAAIGCERGDTAASLPTDHPAEHADNHAAAQAAQREPPPAAAAAATIPQASPREPEPQSPRHESVEVSVNDHRYGPTNGCTTGFSPQQVAGMSSVEHTMTCGHPGAVSKLFWEYLRTDAAGDHYRFERTYPLDEPNAENRVKEVVYAGEELILFEDDTQRIFIRPQQPPL